MRNKIQLLLLLCILWQSSLFAQQNNKDTTKIDTTIKVDLLRGPSSPASNLLGIAASDIERPTNINSFMVSLKNATNNFGAVPNSYAIDFAPFKLFGSKWLDANKMDSTRATVPQTFILSLGVTQTDSTASTIKATHLGFGLKFAITRGKLDDETKAALARINALQKSVATNVSSNYEAFIQKSAVYQEYDRQAKELIMQAKLAKMANNLPLVDSIKEEIKNITTKQTAWLNNLRDKDSMKAVFNTVLIDSLTKEISKQVTKVRFERTGFNLDFSAGGVVDFLDNDFDNSRFAKVGAWLTGGYNDPNTSSLFILRYLYNPKSPFAKPTVTTKGLHTFDAGGRFILSSLLEKKLLLSGEAIYRSILNKKESTDATSSWRLIFNAEYEIGVNQKLTFSFGRNFDGTISKGGNVVSALNYIIGFGKQRFKASTPAP